MRLFVAGPGPGHGGTWAAFAAARGQLKSAGYATVMGFHRIDQRFVDESHGPLHLPDWFDFTAAYLDDADGVALLDGWSRGPGTPREVDYASGRGIRCRSVGWWWRHRGSSAVCDCADE